MQIAWKKWPHGRCCILARDDAITMLLVAKPFIDATFLIFSMITPLVITGRRFRDILSNQNAKEIQLIAVLRMRYAIEW